MTRRRPRSAPGGVAGEHASEHDTVVLTRPDAREALAEDQATEEPRAAGSAGTEPPAADREAGTADLPDAAPEGREEGAQILAGRLRAREARRARRRRRILRGIVAVLLLVAVWWVGWRSPVTLVQHVVVDAPEGISAKVVRKASGIAATDHVPAIDGDLVRDNVVAAVPAVADVRVQRRLPSTVRLEIVPRTAFAAIPIEGGYVVVDPDGVEFDTVRKAGSLTVLSAHTEAGRNEGLAVLRALPDDLRLTVKRLAASTANDVDLTLKGGAVVRWGSAEESELKARVLAGLRAVKASHYDVSAPLMPTTRQ